MGPEGQGMEEHFGLTLDQKKKKKKGIGVKQAREGREVKGKEKKKKKKQRDGGCVALVHYIRRMLAGDHLTFSFSCKVPGKI